MFSLLGLDFFLPNMLLPKTIHVIIYNFSLLILLLCNILLCE